MRRNPGIDTWGEKFDDIGQSQFRSDIVDSGRRIDMISGELGVKVYKYTHAVASLGYEATFLTQQRDDSSSILGDNGKYWTDYRISDESSITAGGGIMVRVPVTDGVALTPKVLFSTAKNVQFSLGFAFGGSGNAGD
ncbi:hypothetical protein [Salinibacter ruber]|uniref:hypothetical protein n=1 Tax=Salinibacter ruber TaxID=146919 RepID=UPI0021678190|nr:hypothetical protein [Salinibacter ruber]MCS3639219.1 hypothetical protein [Salinibacter ruber]